MLSQRAIQIWYAVHKWSSLICAIFLLLLCVTGLPLIFSHEIDHWLGNAAEAPAVTGAQANAKANLDGIIAAAKAHRPGEFPLYLYPDDEEPIWYVSLGLTPGAEDASSVLAFDQRTGERIKEFPLRQGIMYILFKLHVDLFADLPGMLFVGFMGVLFVISTVSGVVVYSPFMTRLVFGTVRRAQGPRVHWLDLHNLLGIVTAVWVLVVGATGVMNALATPILAQWRATELAQMTAAWRGKPAPTAFAPVQAAAETALRAVPGMAISFMGFPGTELSGPHHYGFFLKGPTPLTSRLLHAVLVDAETGRLTDQRGLPWYVDALLISQPLHFGDYGGMPMKVLWALLDVLTIAVLSTGVYLWVLRLRRRQEPLFVSGGVEDTAVQTIARVVQS